MTKHTKVGPKHQITIPKAVFDRLQLAVGDIVEITERNGKATLEPKQMVHKSPAAKLTMAEQKTLARAKGKIDRISQDILHSKGLTKKEVLVAVKAGLIDPDQQWWWIESWQKGEREAEADLAAGRVTTHDSMDAFIASLKS